MRDALLALLLSLLNVAAFWFLATWVEVGR